MSSDRFRRFCRHSRGRTASRASTGRSPSRWVRRRLHTSRSANGGPTSSSIGHSICLWWPVWAMGFLFARLLISTTSFSQSARQNGSSEKCAWSMLRDKGDNARRNVLILDTDAKQHWKHKGQEGKRDHQHELTSRSIAPIGRIYVIVLLSV